MVTSAMFSAAFLEEYQKARKMHDDLTWREVCNDTGRWSLHMLWKEDSVLRATASTLGLSVAKGEPLRLDAVMTANDAPDTWHHFPIHVAVEHENSPWTMGTEIRALLSVRAPLKVGITYFYSEHRKKSKDLIDWMTALVREEYQRAVTLIGEDPKTEYLFLLGQEHETEDWALDWKLMTFSAAEGPGSRFFERALMPGSTTHTS